MKEEYRSDVRPTQSHSDAAVKLRRDEKYKSVFLRFYANACVLAQRGFISQTFYDKGMLGLFHFMTVIYFFWRRKKWDNSVRIKVYINIGYYIKYNEKGLRLYFPLDLYLPTIVFVLPLNILQLDMIKCVFFNTYHYIVTDRSSFKINHGENMPLKNCF